MPESEAAVALLHTLGSTDSVLLIRRAERAGDPWSGHWSLPGGRRDRADCDLLATALRELEEECGIRLGREAMVASLPQTLAGRRVGRFLLVSPFVFQVKEELSTVLDRREAVASLWLPLDVLRDPSRHSLSPVPGVPDAMRYQAVHLEGAPLWGFTYRLISEWLSLGPLGDAAGRAGFEAASLVLDFLSSAGLAVTGGWEDRVPEPGGEQASGVKVATVRGVIPVAEVLNRFSGPGPHVQAVSCLDVGPERIRVVGLASEQYVIQALG